MEDFTRKLRRVPQFLVPDLLFNAFLYGMEEN